LKDDKGKPTCKDLHFFIDSDEEQQLRLQQSGPQMLMINSAAKEPVRKFCVLLMEELNAAASVASMLHHTSGAYKAWEGDLEHSPTLWRAWLKMWDDIGGARVDQWAALRRLQGLVTQRIMRALVAEQLRRFNAKKKGEGGASLALRTELKGSSVASSKRKATQEAAEEGADQESDDGRPTAAAAAEGGGAAHRRRPARPLVAGNEAAAVPGPAVVAATVVGEEGAGNGASGGGAAKKKRAGRPPKAPSPAEQPPPAADEEAAAGPAAGRRGSRERRLSEKGKEMEAALE